MKKRISYLFGSLIPLFTLFLTHCGPGVSIEPDLFKATEWVTLNFDGQVSYSYQLTDPVGTQSVIDRDVRYLQLSNINISQSPPQDLEELLSRIIMTYLRLPQPGKVQIYLGPDLSLKKNGSPVFSPIQQIDYFNTAKVSLIDYQSATDNNPILGELKNDTPIELEGNFVGISTFRKEEHCVDLNGNPVGSGQTPNLVCPAINTKRIETGKIIQTDYSAAQLKQFLDNNQNSMISAGQGVPLTFVIKNISAIVQGSATPTPSSTPSAESQPSGPESQPSGDQSNDQNKVSSGGCNLNGMPTAGTAIAVVLPLLTVLGLGFKRRQRRNLGS